MQTSLVTSPVPPTSPTRDPDLWAAAQSLEGAFLSEMLKTAGLGTPRDSFGGGAGEEPFAGMLADEYANGLASAGGVGLAKSSYRTLASQERAE